MGATHRTNLPGKGPALLCVALVEDDLELRVVIAQGLRREGYCVAEFGDAATLVELQRASMNVCGRGLADVVVSDIRMPRTSGFEMLAALRRFDERTPVILMTAFGDADVHAEGMRLGARVLDKPVLIEDLIVVAQELLASTVRDLAARDETADLRTQSDY